MRSQRQPDDASADALRVAAPEARSFIVEPVTETGTVLSPATK
ncbi:glycerol-3-phosphate dehydrogenase [Mycobacteroides abscessus subsp. abscessus]|nr:glycerol-3-phosphate dehydrogenase [Mycobacteroides abscessus subsp. abscessus]